MSGSKEILIGTLGLILTVIPAICNNAVSIIVVGTLATSAEETTSITEFTFSNAPSTLEYRTISLHFRHYTTKSTQKRGCLNKVQSRYVAISHV